jgi:hypothetical protein
MHVIIKTQRPRPKSGTMTIIHSLLCDASDEFALKLLVQRTHTDNRQLFALLIKLHWEP